MKMGLTLPAISRCQLFLILTYMMAHNKPLWRGVEKQIRPAVSDYFKIRKHSNGHSQTKIHDFEFQLKFRDD